MNSLQAFLPESVRALATYVAHDTDEIIPTCDRNTRRAENESRTKGPFFDDHSEKNRFSHRR